MNMNVFKRKWFLGGLVLVMIFVTASFTAAYAMEPYTKKAELICDNAKIQIVTKCVDDSYTPFPLCIEQRLLFIEQATGKSITKLASGKLMDDLDAKGKKISQSLDALATELHCVKGKTQSYIVVWYYTGGNCDECEWQELLDLNGKRLSSTQSKNSKNINMFNKIWNELGLPTMKQGGYVQGSSNIKIPLRRKDK